MRLRKRWAVDAAAILSTGFAFFVTHFPAPSGVGTSDDDPRRQAVRSFWYGLRDAGRAARDAGYEAPDLLAGDKVIHVLIYLGPGFWWALSVAVRRRLDARSAALLLAVLALWAGLDELSQALLAREGELGDVAANVVGAALGVGAAAALVAGLRAARRRLGRA